MNGLYHNSRGETLVGVIVGALIIALVVGSIARVIAVHYDNEDVYTRNETLYILQNNASNAIRAADTSGITEKDIFSLYKDSVNHRFVVMTGALAEPYKYIDWRGEWVSNTGTFTSTVYTQSFFLDKNDSSPVGKQVIKGEIRELIRGN